jgi:hypothetical protein
MTSSPITTAVVNRRRRPSCVNRQNDSVTCGGSSVNHVPLVVRSSSRSPCRRP